MTVFPHYKDLVRINAPEWFDDPDRIREQITKAVAELHGADAELLVWVSSLPE